MELSRRKALTLSVIAFVLAAFSVYSSSALAAGGGDYPQAVTISWMPTYAPPAVYYWNEHIPYLFTVTSQSPFTQYVTVDISTTEEADHGGPWTVYQLHYKLAPWQTIKKLRYDVVTPSGPVTNDKLKFDIEVNVYAEAFPANGIYNESVLGGGK